MGHYDKTTASLWDRLWFSNEISILSRELRYPVCGAGALYAFWVLVAYQDGRICRTALAAAVTAGLVLALVLIGRLAEKAKRRTIAELDRRLGLR